MQGICLFFPPDRTRQGQRYKGRFTVGAKGEGVWAWAEAWALLDYAGHSVQCEPDEPSWTWTKSMGVQTGMPDYSLNWTKRSSAIQCYQCSLPSWSGQAKVGGLSASSLSLIIDIPSGICARWTSKKIRV